MKLLLSLEAARDVDEIGDYTAKRWGKQQAFRYIRNLHTAFDRLIDNPSLGRRRSDMPPSFFVHTVGSHLIVYRVDVENDRLEVLNILHPSMNVARRLAATLRRLEH